MIKIAWKRGILVLYLIGMLIRSKNIFIHSAHFNQGCHQVLPDRVTKFPNRWAISMSGNSLSDLVFPFRGAGGTCL